MTLINCGTNLILTWHVNCIVSNAVAGQAATFAMTVKELYIPVVTLSTQDNAKLLRKLKSEFKHTIIWNKYHSKTEPLNAPNLYLDFLSDPSFQGVNRLFVLLFNVIDDRTRQPRYSLPTAKLKGYNFMIDGKNFLINQ